MNWLPMGANAEEFETLHEGVPTWLRVPLGRWIFGQIASSDPYGTIHVNSQVLQNFDLKTRNANPLTGRIDGENLTIFLQTLEASESFILIDFLLSEMALGFQSDANKLKEILEKGGSVWTVGDRRGIRGLERRVGKPVQALAESLISMDDAAAQYLAVAWTNCYGLDPNPDVAFSNAVKAVEAKLLHRVSPNDSKATLGKALEVLRKNEQWRLSIEPSEKRTEEDDLLFQMARTLWAGQTDRHGSSVVRNQTQREAEIAVILALAIVQLFTIEHSE